MAILVTGGAGFIGSHTCVELLDAGYEVVVLDNLSNASEKSLDRVKAITGKEVTFYKGDILDRDILNKIFEKESIDSCIHFAGLKAVGESVQKPWEYYNNNISGTLTLVDVMRQHNCKNIIFSSSATVYGDPAQIPITEECPKMLEGLNGSENISRTETGWSLQTEWGVSQCSVGGGYWILYGIKPDGTMDANILTRGTESFNNYSLCSEDGTIIRPLSEV